MLRATGLSLWHGGQVVLSDISVGLDASDRVGVVGPNGQGELRRMVYTFGRGDQGWFIVAFRAS